MKGVISILTRYTRKSIIKRPLWRKYWLFITPPLAGSAFRAGNIDQSNCSNLQIALPLNLGHIIADLHNKSETLTNQIARMVTVALECQIKGNYHFVS
jgi:hypothetical protein